MLSWVQKGGDAVSIAGDLIRGHTDAIILARLMQSDSYGYEINKTISALAFAHSSCPPPRKCELHTVTP